MRWLDKIIIIVVGGVVMASCQPPPPSGKAVYRSESLQSQVDSAEALERIATALEAIAAKDCR